MHIVVYTCRHTITMCFNVTVLNPKFKMLVYFLSGMLVYFYFPVDALMGRSAKNLQYYGKFIYLFMYLCMYLCMYVCIYVCI